MNIVWATRIPDAISDVSAASAYGEVCEAFPRDVAPYDIRRQHRIIRDEVLPRASADDMILVVGPRVMLCVLCLAWSSRFDVTNLLVYDRSARAYAVKTIYSARR